MESTPDKTHPHSSPSTAVTRHKEQAFNKHRLLMRLALFAISGVLAFAVAEVLCQSLVPSRPPLRFQQDVDKLKQFQIAKLAEIVEADSEKFWRLAPNRTFAADASPFPGVISNQQGLREDHEIPSRKPAGEIRILFVGDSCTFGFGLTHTDGFVNLVETRLRAKFPEVSWECINAGVPGYTLFQGWRYLVAQGLDFQPDLVVLNFGWNDGNKWDGLSDLEHYAAMQASIPPPALRWSRLCQLLWTAANIPDSPATRAATRTRLSPDEFRSVLAKIDEATTAHGADLMLLVWPMRWNVAQLGAADKRSLLQFEQYEYGRRRAAASQPTDVPAYIDLVPVAQKMAQQYEISEIFIDAGHATGRANHQFARTIVEHLEPWLRRRARSLKDARSLRDARSLKDD